MCDLFLPPRHRDTGCAKYQFTGMFDLKFPFRAHKCSQWYDLSQKDIVPKPSLKSHPSLRRHRFFDSRGPGGITATRSNAAQPDDEDGQLLEIRKSSIIQYAHFGYVYCMALVKSPSFSEENVETLVTGGGDGAIKLWKVQQRDGLVSLTQSGVFENGDESILTIALKDTLLYAGKLEGEIDVWDLDARQRIQTFKAADVDILSLAVGYGYVFAGTANGRAKIFERHRRKTDWKAHDELILASALTENNGTPYLVTGGNDNCVAIWNLADFFGKQPSLTRQSNEVLLQSLSRFISFRTVSSRNEYNEDCRQGASWLRNLFKRFGAQTELLRTDSRHNPAVYACFKGKYPGGKRSLFYGHYDVVPADNDQDRWKTEPFSLHGRDGYLYGRGVSDNKGPILAAAYAIADLVATQQLRSDVVFLVEGEEESGSRGFEKLFKDNKHLIGDISWILLANSYWLNNDFPCLTYGLRGVVHATISIESGNTDMHSGVNGSNATHEPLKDLVTLISRVTDSSNHVSVPGFYDHIRPFTKQEEQWYGAISETLSQGDAMFPNPESLKSKWREPSFTVHGFTTSSSGVATVIPHRATVKVSFRLVPDQEAIEISEAFYQFVQSEFANLNSPNKLHIELGDPVDPWLGDPNNGLYQTLEEAIIEVWGLQKPVSPAKEGQHRRSVSKSLRRPLYIREGGSIPVIRFLEKELNAPAAQLPCGQASDNAHLENERLRLTNLYNAREIFKKVFMDLPDR